MLDIRRLCEGNNNIHSRYMADNNGVIYVNHGVAAFRVVDNSGIRRSVIPLKRKMLKHMADNNMMLMQFNECNKFFLLNNGSILKRVSTRYMKEKNRVDISINFLNGRDRGDRMYVHQAIASAFLGDYRGLEVHHIDGNPMNNKLSNLELLTRDEHLTKHRSVETNQ